MASRVDYLGLYELQDRVLASAMSAETDLYLTGGTCLHRFYYERRYSDDLDLFSADAALFRDYLRETLETLEGDGYRLEILVDTHDFVRATVNGTLKIDVVNDRVLRYGRSVRTEGGLRIDNIGNITANKITAIVGRDEPKDVFDLFILARNESFDWKEILKAAERKSVFEREYLLYRLVTVQLLSEGMYRKIYRLDFSFAL